MKYLTLFLIVTIAALPLQADFCVVATNPDASEQSSIIGQDSLESATQEHGRLGAAHGGHDCCNPGQEDPSDSCEFGLQCGFCTAGVLSINDINPPGSYFPMSRTENFNSGVMAPSHSSPPYRPPIA